MSFERHWRLLLLSCLTENGGFLRMTFLCEACELRGVDCCPARTRDDVLRLGWSDQLVGPQVSCWDGQISWRDLRLVAGMVRSAGGTSG